MIVFILVLNNLWGNFDFSPKFLNFSLLPQLLHNVWKKKKIKILSFVYNVDVSIKAT